MKKELSAIEKMMAVKTAMEAFGFSFEHVTVAQAFTMFANIKNTIQQTNAAAKPATRVEFLFNFIGGGWNSEWAFTPEEAITQAITRFGDPRLASTTCRVDIASFRVATTSDHNNLISSFY
jgi:hypothetical protein